MADIAKFGKRSKGRPQYDEVKNHTLEKKTVKWRSLENY